MNNAVKYLFYFAIAGFLLLVVLIFLAYIGPLIGIDLSPAQMEIRLPVQFDVE